MKNWTHMFFSRKSKKQHQPLVAESGNVFLMLFGAVAMVGVLGASTMTVLRGPVKTMSQVTKRTLAENNMMATAKIAVVMASQNASADCDADDFVEPDPWVNPITGFTGGGTIPATIGVTRQDPWGNEYGYCVWDHGTIDDSGCGGTLQNRLAGDGVSPTVTDYVVAIVSAGADGSYQSTCQDYTGSGTQVTRNGDDIVFGYSYQEAANIAGGLWTEQGASTARISRDLIVDDGASTPVETLNFTASSGDFRVSNSGEFPILKTDNIQGVGGTTSNITIDNPIIVTNSITASGDISGADLIASANADITGTLDVTGLSTLGTLNSGATTAASLSSSGTLNVTGISTLTGNTTVGGDLSVGGTLSLTNLTVPEDTILGTTTGDNIALNGSITTDVLMSSGNLTLTSGNATIGGTLSAGNTTLNDLTVNGALTTALNAGGFGIISLLDPSNPQDAATKIYVDTEITDAMASGSVTEDDPFVEDVLNTGDLCIGKAGNIVGCDVTAVTAFETDPTISSTLTSGELCTWNGTQIQCNTATAAVGAAGVWTNNTNSINYENQYIIKSGQTSTTALLDGDGTRAFYDPNKGAFRGGTILGGNDAWADANVGNNSFAWGENAEASGINSIALARGLATGNNSIALGGARATNNDTVALGWNVTASGPYSTVIGTDSAASGAFARTFGRNSHAAGLNSTAIGQGIRVNGDYSMGFSMGNNGFATAARVSGAESAAFFFGIQNSEDITATNVLALEGGSLLLSNDSGTACAADKAGALRLNATANGLEMCDGAGTWTSTFSGGGGGSVNAINDLTDGITDYITDFNMFMGNGAGVANNIGAQFNFAIGQNALSNNTTGGSNFALGYNALNSNVGKIESTAIGFEAMRYADNSTANTDTQNTAVGYRAMMGSTTASANTGRYNTAIGHESLLDLTSGGFNTGLGQGSLKRNTTGSTNVAIGGGALFNNIDGNRNTAVGTYSMLSKNGGNNNTAVGYRSQQGNSSINTENSSLGAYSIYRPTTGSYNTAVGLSSLRGITTGNNNIAFGFQAGNSITTGNDNIIIGYNTDASSATASEELNIGNLIKGDIGTTSTDPRIGAPKYCDENLANCFIATDVSGGGALTTDRIQDLDNNTYIDVDTSNDGLSDSIDFNLNGSTRFSLSGPNASLDGRLFARTTNGLSAAFKATSVPVGSGPFLLFQYSGIDIDSGTIGFPREAGTRDSSFAVSTADNGSISEKFRVTSNGDMGIGLTEPYSKLHVDGDLLLSNSATICGANQAGALRLNATADGLEMCDGAGTWTSTFSGGGATGGSSLNDLTDVLYDITTNFDGDGNDDDDNLFIGHTAAALTTGTQNIVIGSLSGNAITEASRNLIAGYQAGRSLTTGGDNVFLGGDAGENNTTGDHNVFAGNDAGQNNISGRKNVMIGYDTGHENTSGDLNVFIGSDNAIANISGSRNVYIGQQAGQNLTTASDNVFIGQDAGRDTTTASQSVFIGQQAGLNAGSSNTFLGFYSGRSALGTGNIAMGHRSAQSLSSGSNNVFLGNSIASTLTSGSSNIYIGSGVDSSAATVSEELNIGDLIKGDIGTTSTDPRIGAPKYCDENLANCFIATDVSGGGALTIDRIQDLDNNTYIDVDDSNDGTSNAIEFYSGGVRRMALAGNSLSLNGRLFTETTNTTSAVFKATVVNVGAGPYISFGYEVGAADFNSGNMGFVREVGGGDSAYVLRVAKSNSLSERMRVTSDGEVGIGTTTPSEVLDVDGSINVSASNGYKHDGQFIYTDKTNAIGQTTQFLANRQAAPSFDASATSPGRNLIIGDFAGEGMVNFHSNTFIGEGSGRNVDTGNENTFIGQAAGEGLRSGNENIFIGRRTGYMTTTTGDSSDNVLIGNNIGSGTVDSIFNNVIIGSKAASAVTTASRNILIGKDSGDSITTGTDNIIIGYSTDASSATASEELNIGDLIKGDIGTTSTDPRIGAPKYCDENLANCFIATDVSSNNAGGADTQIQFNNAGTLDGDAAFTWDSTNDILDVNGSINAQTRITLGQTTGAAAPTYPSPADLWSNGTGDDIYYNTGTTPQVGIGTTTPAEALDVVGNIQYSGILVDASDRRLKENITPLDNKTILSRIEQIDTYSFTMIGDSKKQMEFGVIAQELEKIFPELVTVANDEMKTRHVNYVGFIAPLIESTKQLKIENDILKAELSTLKNNQEQILQDMAEIKSIMGINSAKGAKFNSYLLLLSLIIGGGIMVAFSRRQKVISGKEV